MLALPRQVNAAAGEAPVSLPRWFRPADWRHTAGKPSGKRNSGASAASFRHVIVARTTRSQQMEEIQAFQARMRREFEKDEQQAQRAFRICMAILAAIVIGLVLLFWQLWRVGERNYQTFMQECLQYHKRYECTLMWRAGESREAPILIPVPIPTGR
jgi:hypothetical protein